MQVKAIGGENLANKQQSAHMPYTFSEWLMIHQFYPLPKFSPCTVIEITCIAQVNWDRRFLVSVTSAPLLTYNMITEIVLGIYVS